MWGGRGRDGRCRARGGGGRNGMGRGERGGAEGGREGGREGDGRGPGRRGEAREGGGRRRRAKGGERETPPLRRTPPLPPHTHTPTAFGSPPPQEGWGRTPPLLPTSDAVDHLWSWTLSMSYGHARSRTHTAFERHSMIHQQTGICIIFIIYVHCSTTVVVYLATVSYTSI